MPAEPLRIFDPRRNFQLQGFTGRGATATLHDATATGVSISGIFQAAEAFAVLGFYNAYDYFNHLRQKHLPRTDLSGLILEFDIEYDHALDGAMRLDAAKYPSVSWDAMTFVCGKGGAGEIHEVKLLSYATVVSGGETPASVSIEASGEYAEQGTDHVVGVFRDTVYNCIAQGQWHQLPRTLVSPTFAGNSSNHSTNGHDPSSSRKRTTLVLGTRSQSIRNVAKVQVGVRDSRTAGRSSKLTVPMAFSAPSGHDPYRGINCCLLQQTTIRTRRQAACQFCGVHRRPSRLVLSQLFCPRISASD